MTQPQIKILNKEGKEVSSLGNDEPVTDPKGYVSEGYLMNCGNKNIIIEKIEFMVQNVNGDTVIDPTAEIRLTEKILPPNVPIRITLKVKFPEQLQLATFDIKDAVNIGHAGKLHIKGYVEA